MPSQQWEWDRNNLWRTRAKLLRVIDGDSLIALCDCGFSIRYEARIRIAGLWNPETHEPGGSEATMALMRAVESGVGEWPMRIVTQQRETIISEVRSFERWVASVYVCQEGREPVDVRELMTWRGRE